MLSLTRRVGETITIEVGDLPPLVITVEGTGGNVRLSFEGPKDYRILREELSGGSLDRRMSARRRRA